MARQASAADALEDSTLTLVNGEARIQTTLSPIMLPTVINPEAEKLMRTALRDHGILKLTLLPGEAVAATPKKPRTARPGSAQSKAMEHPLVQQAQKLFEAEIQSVIDLRGKE